MLEPRAATRLGSTPLCPPSRSAIAITSSTAFGPTSRRPIRRWPRASKASAPSRWPRSERQSAGFLLCASRRRGRHDTGPGRGGTRRVRSPRRSFRPAGSGQPERVCEAAVAVLAVGPAGRRLPHAPILPALARLARGLSSESARITLGRHQGPSPTCRLTRSAPPVYPSAPRERARPPRGRRLRSRQPSEEFGTPADIYAEDDVRARARDYVRAFSERTEDFEVIFASKALPATAAYARSRTRASPSTSPPR